MPTVRLALTVAAGAALWALGLTPFAWAYNLALAITVAWEAWTVHKALKRLGVERGIANALEIGAPHQVTLSLSNPTPIPLIVTVKDEPPMDFQWDALRKEANQLRPLLTAFIPARHSATVAYTVTPMRRGEFNFGDTDLRISTPLGLVQLPLRLSLPQTVRVLPNLSQARKYELLMRKMRLRDLGFRPMPLRGAGTEFASLRDYLPDDDPRWIDWNATARRSKLVSKEFELERGQNIVAVLDAGRVMATRLDGLTKFDHAVNAAAFLLYLAHRLDDRIGLMVFADRIFRWLPPRKGVRQWNAILQALRQAEPHLVEANYADAFTRLLQNLPRRSLLIVFTDLIDPDTSEALLTHARLSAEKHLVLVVALSDYELQTLLTEAPKEPTDVYRQAAAVVTLNDRLHAIAQLRERDISVLDTAPEGLFAALVEQYLLAKRKL